MQELKNFDIATSVTDSLIEIFQTMLSMELELAQDDLELDKDSRIVGSVSLAGKIKGSIFVQVSQEFARMITASMQDVDLDEIKDNEDVKDVIRELCNIVGGNLKSLFCDAGLVCELSPPSFTTGTDFEIRSLNTARYERYVFQYEGHPVIVEIAVRADEAESDDFLGKDNGDHEQIDIKAIQAFNIRDPLVSSTIELFDTMLSMEIEEKDFSGNDMSFEEERIVGAVNMAGLITGNVSLYITKNFAWLMTASMLGIEPDEVEGEEDVKDVISELCNIIGGNLKSKLCDAGMFCTLSTPSYTSGTDFIVERQDMTAYERVKFVHKNEEFYIEAGIKLSESAGMSAVTSTEEEDANSIESVISQDDIDALLRSEVSKPETDKSETTSAEEIQGEIDNIIKSESPKVKAQVEDEQSVQDDLNQGSDSGSVSEDKNMELVLDIPLEIKIEFGKTSKRIDEVVKIDNGSVIEFPNMEGEPVNLVVNNTLIAKGKVVVEKERYGVRITETVSRVKRIQSMM